LGGRDQHKLKKKELGKNHSIGGGERASESRAPGKQGEFRGGGKWGLRIVQAFFHVVKRGRSKQKRARSAAALEKTPHRLRKGENRGEEKGEKTSFKKKKNQDVKEGFLNRTRKK